MVILNQSVPIYILNVKLMFVSVKRTAQISFRMFLQTRIMMNGAKFNSHDSVSHFLEVNF